MPCLLGSSLSICSARDCGSSPAAYSHSSSPDPNTLQTTFGSKVPYKCDSEFKYSTTTDMDADDDVLTRHMTCTFYVGSAAFEQLGWKPFSDRCEGE